MFSHHSHSGEFCGHGNDLLDELLEEVERKGFHTYCLTEHMPRISPSLLYEEERNSRTDTDELRRQFERYLAHSRAIISQRDAFKCTIIIGMEAEGCDPHHINYSMQLMELHRDVLKFCIGSVHHVKGIPIDFNQALWNDALNACGNSVKDLLISYFDQQYRMLLNLKPKIVGHFDLIRLFLPTGAGIASVNKKTGRVFEYGTVSTENPVNNDDWIPLNKIYNNLISFWDQVEDRVIRNIQFVNSYGGLFEINSAGLRKGLTQPYPHEDVANLIKIHGAARFVLSDDAHSVKQVGTNYSKTLYYADQVLKLPGLYYLIPDSNYDEVVEKFMPMADIKSNPFWEANNRG